MRRFEVLTSIICAAALAASCKGSSKKDMAPEKEGRTAAALEESGGAGGAAPPGGAMKQDVDRAKAGGKNFQDPAAPPAVAPMADGFVVAENKAGLAPVTGTPARLRRTNEEQAAPTRSWFPETFLFRPLVVTDASGVATVEVKVPDRLTTWRVLALGHSRSGAQGGAVTSFLGTLAAYVEPVVPPFLMAGDEIRLPIQMVNTTSEAIASELAVDVENAAITAAQGARKLPAQGSLVEYATLKAARPGRVKLRAVLGATDAVERFIDVMPSGRPVATTRSGTLAAPRTLTIEGPSGADAATDRVRLMVFPGALALLRSELAISTARSGLSDDAYALLLAGRAPALLSSLGDKADPEVLRNLAIVVGQRAIRHARSLDVPGATALAAAALAHPQNPVLARLGERAAELLAKSQRPDGTFQGGDGWTLQRLLIATADGTRAVAAADTTPAARQRAQAVAFRAAGAFERNADAVQDAYTAAAILATGAVKGPIVDKLRQRVRDAVRGDAGSKWLEAGEGVVRADGTIPGRAEATARAVLALEGDPKATALRADLGATLLGSYSPAHGWGDGHANLACMQAVLALFQAPLPARVNIALTLDGKQVVSGSFDREKLRDVLVLEGPAGASVAGAHEWRIAAEPAVPGLGYSLALQSYVPWEKETVKAGLELSLPAVVTATVGKPTEINLTAVAPSGMGLHITHALPAGVQADRPSLDALVTSGVLSRFEIADGKIELYAAALDPGEVLSAKYRIIPTFAGKLLSGPSRIRAGAHEVHVPPARWTIR